MARTTKALYATVFLLVGLGLLHNQRNFNLTSRGSPQAYTGYVSSEHHVQHKHQFSWDTVPAHKTLKWHDCYEKRECARLLVPMNYSDPDGEQYNLALIRKPAVVPPESGFYRGPVLFNPGGPGGSGVDMIRTRGEQFSAILGPQFDILSFDPRGISRSTPRATFFESDVAREIWTREGSSANMSDVPRIWARARVESQLAGETDTGYLKHINTDNTARDMLRIVEAHGKEKIQYWGFSYGSILGATFAAMFPDKIERLIIDGVADSENYYATLWSNNLVDAEKVMDSFYTGCAAAGPDGCPFWAPTADDIRQNLTTLSNSLRTNPIPIRTKSGYGLLDINKLQSALFTALYSPYAAFPAIAQGLAELAAGSGKLLFDRMNPPLFECACDSPELPFTSVSDSQAAVACNDGDDVPDDLQSTEAHFAMMRKASPWGEYWANIRTACVGWPKFPKDHFQGPFVGNTSHPILLIGNTADPVTPLWAANKMSKGFKDSVVLTQNSAGHCSISAPSLCSQKYIRDYFVDGTLPPPGTVCEPVSQPFPPAEMSIGDVEEQALLSANLTPDEVDILEAVLQLSKDPGITPPTGAMLF
ncbi:hypothetical protein HYPSUDRAFT_45508 [Hypholoma sublateritium FD-334 SS-4]|uniref:AB hydrolase-1 domain-containing protein n=1 Tax=Hypholoma sublateritium (strain FD-334 SS-4) TaxID=945553 RepID=A0A0D2NN92_HYPSF|nr:hypothetical protein HYPSUDRAFT_45508 [Hypholoma sublateritium FD-334 SS-4]